MTARRTLTGPRLLDPAEPSDGRLPCGKYLVVMLGWWLRST
ncbi:hypothetical protein PJI17_14310 [Mycobacterium kansasii]